VSDLGIPSLDAEHEWLLLGAEEKAASIVTLLGGADIRSVLEVGSGTGAVLERLDRAGFAERYYALEPSAALLNYMVRRGAITRLVDADAATLRRSRLGRSRYDLVILSHVLEHVEDPGRLLCDALDIGEFVIVEVPLEGSVLGNVRSTLKKWLTKVPRRDNAAGHIQFFGYRDIRDLVQWCGGTVLVSRLYVPRAQLRREFTRGSFPRNAYHGLLLFLSRLAPALWARYYHGHCAVLIGLRHPMEPPNQSRWPSANYYEPVRPATFGDS